MLSVSSPTFLNYVVKGMEFPEYKKRNWTSSFSLEQRFHCHAKSQNQGINEKFAIKCSKYKFKTESLSSTLADVCEVYANSSDDLSAPNKEINDFDSNLHPPPPMLICDT